MNCVKCVKRCVIILHTFLAFVFMVNDEFCYKHVEKP